MIASNWSLIAEEQAFVKRCSDVGDELGSTIVCTRIAERLLRLCFLYSNRYAPYSKWFGKAFSDLNIDIKIVDDIKKAVFACKIEEREDSIVLAQKMLAELHNKSNLTEFVDVQIESYYGGNIKVVFADKLSEAAAKKLKGSTLDNFSYIGKLGDVANFSMLSDEAKYIDNIKSLHK